MTRKTSSSEPLGGQADRFREDLLGWYRRARRRLPWRESPSAYGTVVSEFMLQQTQVATVIAYYERWTAQLPGFAELAAASEDKVLGLWEGLGYYSRARNLHKLARLIVELPQLPTSAAAWIEFPGVGPYTAAAIGSIAFNDPAACVDGNVVRILSRLTRDGQVYRDGASAARALSPLAQALLNREAPGDHNQAMMELGATVCLRRAPLCLNCPVRAHCAAAAHADPEEYPVIQRRPTEQVAVARVWSERSGSLLLHRNGPGARRLAGIHELPTADQAGLDPSAPPGPLLARKVRGITHHRVTESIHRIPPTRIADRPGLVWVAISDLESVLLSGPHRKWTREILSRGAAGAPG